MIFNSPDANELSVPCDPHETNALAQHLAVPFSGGNHIIRWQISRRKTYTYVVYRSWKILGAETRRRKRRVKYSDENVRGQEQIVEFEIWKSKVWKN